MKLLPERQLLPFGFGSLELPIFVNHLNRKQVEACSVAQKTVYYKQYENRKNYQKADHNNTNNVFHRMRFFHVHAMADVNLLNISFYNSSFFSTLTAPMQSLQQFKSKPILSL